MGPTPKMNCSPKGGARSSLHYGGEGVLILPPHQGVCRRHGTKEQRVTSGGLAASSVGTGESEPISGSEMASEARSVVGRLNSTSSAGEIGATDMIGDRVGRGRQPAKTVGRSGRSDE